MGNELKHKKGDRVVVLADDAIAAKSPRLTAGVEYACEVVCRMEKVREPGYRVRTGPMLEFQIPASAVVRQF